MRQFANYDDSRGHQVFGVRGPFSPRIEALCRVDARWQLGPIELHYCGFIGVKPMPNAVAHRLKSLRTSVALFAMYLAVEQ